ncbi:hypothetical protein WMF37_51405 [Sorangium sp. So ce291]|uniref:hypothetical protein n=1 Tax=Sorangium sp. So ce291 TaxID=3133294 RepID=UPI003F5F34C6
MVTTTLASRPAAAAPGGAALPSAARLAHVAGILCSMSLDGLRIMAASTTPTCTVRGGIEL